ncbi:hypothetical protein DM02DRAFT_659423 [Periconia macrospinosa]|uniref:Carrier domain-containing protein n=1 Tax=Periconia macrospinosa TaxID=97972 RepID=A0A2V1DDG0_9PLEO|nr:hypothetical protein DM02DRAFT_659423 [Periconia macrospinosa]
MHPARYTEQWYRAGTWQARERQPANQIETRLRNLWAEVLNVPANGIALDVPFTQFGADSISAIELTTKARKNGLSINAQGIMATRTVARLSELAREEISQPPKTEFVMNEEYFDLTPIQTIYYETIAEHNGPVFSAILLTNEGSNILFLVAAHLIIDLVSWPVLVAELQEWATIQSEQSKDQLNPLETLSAAPLPSDLNFWGAEENFRTFGTLIEQPFTVKQDVSLALLGPANSKLNTETLGLLLAAAQLSSMIQTLLAATPTLTLSDVPLFQGAYAQLEKLQEEARTVLGKDATFEDIFPCSSLQQRMMTA